MPISSPVKSAPIVSATGSLSPAPPERLRRILPSPVRVNAKPRFAVALTVYCPGARSSKVYTPLRFVFAVRVLPFSSVRVTVKLLTIFSASIRLPEKSSSRYTVPEMLP